MKGHRLSEGPLAPPRARTKQGAASPFSPLLPSRLSPGFLWAEPPKGDDAGKIGFSESPPRIIKLYKWVGL